MDVALAEWAPLVVAVEEGRQLALLHAELPLETLEERTFLLYPLVDAEVPDEGVRPEHRDLVEEARARYDAPSGVRVTAWARLVGFVPVDDARREAVAGAGIWTRDLVDAWCDEATGAVLSLLEPHVLETPVVVGPIDGAERGRVVTLEEDVDTGGSRPVLGGQQLRDRHELLKTALGVMV